MEPSGAAAMPVFADLETFVRSHLAGTIPIDFLTVPTITFHIVYVFFVLSLERQRVLHVNATAHPYVAWAAQQIVRLSARRSASRRTTERRKSHRTSASRASAKRGPRDRRTAIWPPQERAYDAAL
jgi:hypothetical protein